MKKEALIIVDYQNDFAHPEGSLYVQGGETILPFINNLIQEVKSRSGIIITSQDWHPENHISFASTFGLDDFTSKDGEIKWPKHCVENTWGAEFLDGFDSDGVDRKVLKGYKKDIDSYSSFGGIEKATGSTLDTILKSYNTQVLHIVGLATEYCDYATVEDAIKLGYEVVVHTRGIKAVNVNPHDGIIAISKMNQMGAKILP
ncbi:MAG: isochorismatase family protein [Candidatus Altimarinota bacterium]